MNELVKIYNSYDIQKYYKYLTDSLCDKLILNNIDEKVKFTQKYIDCLYLVFNNFSNSNYEFKNKHITNHVIEIYNIGCIDKITDCHFLQYIITTSVVKECHNIFKKLNINRLCTIEINSLIHQVSSRGMVQSFIYIYDYMNEKRLTLSDENKISILINSFKNSDDRIYKYLLNLINIGKFIEKQELEVESIKSDILTNIFEKHIPEKYKLKRLKALNSIVNLDNMLSFILQKSIEYYKNTTDIKLNHVNVCNFIDKLLKYYYNSQSRLEHNIIYLLLVTIHSQENMDTYKLKENILRLYSIFNSYDKNILIFEFLNLIVKPDMLGDTEIINTLRINNSIPIDPIILDGYINNYIRIILYSNSKYPDILNSPLFNKIIQSIPKNLISKNLNEYEYNRDVLLLFPYISYFSIGDHDINHVVKLNRCLLQLRLYIRKIKKYNHLNKKIKIYPLLNEMINIKPNSLKPIFKNGTEFYKNMKQKYNTIPPYHIFPGQLQIIKPNTVLIREKADGVLTNIIPTDIFPSINFQHAIKAEYIEELDLYLIIDIDINMTIEDRYMYLRKLHPYIQSNNLYSINTIEDMKKYIGVEREQLKQFLAMEYTNYRWYPKCAWKIESIDNIIEHMTNFINGTDVNMVKWICDDGIISNDGFILTHLDGSREIKIKPKKYNTIDLLYKDGKWLDREGNNYNDIIIINDDVSNNTIWRCYPNQIDPHEIHFEPREIRIDKSKPNKMTIVNNIIRLYKETFLPSYPSIYRTVNQVDLFYKNLERDNMNEIKSTTWGKIVHCNNNIIQQMIKKLPCKNILDLGCGNGKLLKYIKNIKYYCGLDLDVCMLATAINRYGYEDMIQFINMNLGDWDNKYNKINNNIDTIVAINSIQHFSTDKFWTQLNQHVKKDSMMLFNLVTMDCVKYSFDTKSYILRENNIVKYYFETIHCKEMSEPYIDNIMETLDRYGWKIYSTYCPDSILLPKYYTWYIVVKI